MSVTDNVLACCSICGEDFTPKRADAQTCSPACRQKAYRLRKGAMVATPTIGSVTDTPLNTARSLVRCGDCRHSQPVNAAEPLGRCLCTVGLVGGGGSPLSERRCLCWQAAVGVRR